jgi:hypothetical protein
MITDDSKAFASAVKTFNELTDKKILHLLDNFHVLRNIKKKLN